MKSKEQDTKIKHIRVEVERKYGERSRQFYWYWTVFVDDEKVYDGSGYASCKWLAFKRAKNFVRRQFTKKFIKKWDVKCQ